MPWTEPVRSVSCLLVRLFKRNNRSPFVFVAVPAEPAPQPKIDWEQEAELSARNGAAKQDDYRNLSAPSPAQLSWIKKNHMRPMTPGLQWTHRRVQFDRDTGLPMVWINDHCVLVTVFVFCAIGKIEANGELFKHMRDPTDP